MKWTAPIYFVTIFGKSQRTDHNTNNSDVNSTACKCSPVTSDQLTEISLLEIEIEKDEEND